MPHNTAPAPLERLVVATANPGKLREFRSLLAGLPFELTSLAELELPSPEESGASFLENATIEGAPCRRLERIRGSGRRFGTRSRCPGRSSGHLFGPLRGRTAPTITANNAKLLRELKGIPLERRRARYRCALVFVSAARGSPRR